MIIASESANAHPAQRLATKYRFEDPDMDLFFTAALGWGPSGGLDVGQAFHVASHIVDGDADSWVNAFSAYAERQNAQADDWLQRGARRNAGEARLKAFAAYRSAWQFAAPGAHFAALVRQQRVAFAQAMNELGLPARFFDVPYADRMLPGVVFEQADAAAPMVLVIGGADTSYDDLFLSVGRRLFERGYSIALADLPGQSATQAEGLHWEVEAERPIADVIDHLIAEHGARAGRIGLLGLSLGGYFVTRAAGFEPRLATAIASTPLPNPGQLFRLSVEAAIADASRTGKRATVAAQRSRQLSLWKAGARTPQEFVERTAGMVADPARVTLPFLSILGSGDSPVFAQQAHEWHEHIASERKRFVLLDAASGADGHCQVANRGRLVQEAAAWLDEIFGR